MNSLMVCILCTVVSWGQHGMPGGRQRAEAHPLHGAGVGAVAGAGVDEDVSVVVVAVDVVSVSWCTQNGCEP